jgi:predicted transcriptional regulator
MKLHTIATSKNTVIDSDTGEVLKENTSYKHILLRTKEEFFFTYSSVIGLYKNLSGSEIKILTWLIMNQSNVSNNLVIINKYIREKISIDMGIGESTIKNSIKPLMEKGLLIKQGGKRSASYFINPKYYWKGDYKMRTKSLKMMLELKLDESFDEEEEVLQVNENFYNDEGDKPEKDINEFEEITKLKF